MYRGPRKRYSAVFNVKSALTLVPAVRAFCLWYSATSFCKGDVGVETGTASRGIVIPPNASEAWIS